MKKDHNTINKKKENLEEGDLLWMLSPVYNDYHRETDNKRLGENKIRPGYINKKFTSSQNKNYFLVTHGTSNERKGTTVLYVEKGGTEYRFNSTETYLYPEEQLNSLQRNYIGSAHPDTFNARILLQGRIKDDISTMQNNNINRTISAITTGTEQKINKLIQKRTPEPTKEDVWHKKVYQNSRKQFKSVVQREQYINANLHNYPWLDDEPNE